MIRELLASLVKAGQIETGTIKSKNATLEVQGATDIQVNDAQVIGLALVPSQEDAATSKDYVDSLVTNSIGAITAEDVAFVKGDLNYVLTGEDVQAAIAEIDGALKSVDDRLGTAEGDITDIQDSITALATGLDWRPGVFVATADSDLAGADDDTALSSLLPLSDDETGTPLAIEAFAAGMYLLSDGATPKLFRVYADAQDGDTLKVTTADVVELAAGHVFLVKKDLLDSPAAKEGASIYTFDGANLLKIGDVDWSLATGINLSASYEPAAAGGTFSAGDTIEAAIAHLEGDQFKNNGTVSMTGDITLAGNDILSGAENEMTLNSPMKITLDSPYVDIGQVRGEEDDFIVSMLSPVIMNGNDILSGAENEMTLNSPMKITLDSPYVDIGQTPASEEDTFKVNMLAPLDMNTVNKIINLHDPEDSQDAATKSYVDSAVEGKDQASEISFDPGTAPNALIYAVGAEDNNTVQKAIEQLDAELVAQDGRLDDIETADLARPLWKKYTVAFGDLSYEGTTKDIELFSLAAKEVIHGVVVKHSAAFTGGDVTAVNVSVGVDGDLSRYSSAFDVSEAPGSALAQATSVLGPEDFVSATSIKLAAVATGGNLEDLTAGSLEVWVLVAAMP